MSAEIAIRARIEGQVQGVAFRNWTCVEAKNRGLTGSVRNSADGSVLALFMGPAEMVAEMVRALAKGPPAARVTSVDTETVAPDPDVTGFRIIR